jgi:hypothetical protein
VWQRWPASRIGRVCTHSDAFGIAEPGRAEDTDDHAFAGASRVDQSVA